MMRAVDIAGGGVAGLALGLALRRSAVPVRLHEAGAYPRHRLCGEFISGAGPAEFAQLGLTGVTTAGETLHDAVWFRGDHLLLRRDLPEPALGISRWLLDQTMADRFMENGGELHCDTRIPPEQSGEGWVRATGRAKTGTSPWLGLKAHYQNLPMHAGLEMHLGHGGYAGIARVENGTANVCALLPTTQGKLPPGATLTERLRACGLDALAGRLTAAEEVTASRCGVSHFMTGWQQKTAGPALGDHCAIIPPFTGHGMSMALLAALETAPILTKWSADSISWAEACRQMESALRRRFSARLRWAAWLHPILLRSGGQALLSLMARTGLVPWQWLYRRVR